MTILPLAILALMVALLINNIVRNRSEAVLEPEPITESNAEDERISQIGVEVLTPGQAGLEAQNGDRLTVHYTGTLEDGTEFDSSRGGTPFTLTLGQGSVIQGWEQGLVGVRVGERLKLTIPPELGYGSNAVSSIPPNSTLIFDIEVLAIDRSE